MTSRIIKPLLLLALSVSLLFLPVFATASAKEYPAPTAAFYVNDFANVLDSATKNFIFENGAALERSTSAQVVVVTVDGIGDNVLEEYSLGLFREWGIGDKEKNNGVLILVDIGGRQSRIEVGYGLEGALPDGKTGRIQDAFMIPHFREGNYSQGIKKGFEAIVNEVYSEYGYEDRLIGEGALASTAELPEGIGIDPRIARIIVIAILILALLDYRFTRGLIIMTILRLLFGGIHIRYKGGRGGGRWGGGGFGGGGFGGGGFGGGGFGGGGGGSAGGGGSSRSW